MTNFSPETQQAILQESLTQPLEDHGRKLLGKLALVEAEKQRVAARSKDSESLDMGVDSPGEKSSTIKQEDYEFDETEITDPDICKRLSESLLTQAEMLNLMLPENYTIPTLEDFDEAEANFKNAETATKAYNALNHPSNLILAPLNLPVDTLQEAFKNARKYQETNYPNAANKLQQQANGDGLYFKSSDAAADIYNEYHKNDSKDSGTKADGTGENKYPGTVVEMTNEDSTTTLWGMLVMPTDEDVVSNLGTANTSHDLSTQSNSTKKLIEDLNKHGMNLETGMTAEVNIHPPLGAYLAQQLQNIYMDKPLLDEGEWAWLMETASGWALGSYWVPYSGRMYVSYGAAGRSGADLGVRFSKWV